MQLGQGAFGQRFDALGKLVTAKSVQIQWEDDGLIQNRGDALNYALVHLISEAPLSLSPTVCPTTITCYPCVGWVEYARTHIVHSIRCHACLVDISDLGWDFIRELMRMRCRQHADPIILNPHSQGRAS